MKQARLFIVIVAAAWLLYPNNAQAQVNAWQALSYDNFNYFNPACTFDDTLHQYRASFWGKYRIQEINVSGEHPLDAVADFQGHVINHPEWSYSVGFIWDGYSFMNMYNFYGSFSYKWTWGVRSLSLGARMRVYCGHVMWDKMAVPVPDRYGKADVYIFPDFDLGLEYKVKYYSLRLSCMNVFAPRVGPNYLTIVHTERKLVWDNRFDCNIQNKVLLVPHFLFAFGWHTIYAQIGMYVDFWHWFHISADICGAELNQVYSIGTSLPCGLDIDLCAEHAPNHDSQTIEWKISYRF